MSNNHILNAELEAGYRRIGENTPTLAEPLFLNMGRWGILWKSYKCTGLPEGTSTEPY
jgi:hypothetical protein